jgi:hypothetical protein
MNLESVPTPTEEDTFGPLRFGTAMLISQIMERGVDDEGKPLSTDEAFELASKIALTPGARRYSRGTAITGTNGEPAVEWIFASAPYRKYVRSEGFADVLSLWAPGTMEEYLGRLLDPLVLWIMDLPASEANHHAYPYGLLDHALEVGLAAAMACAKVAEHDHFGGDLPERVCGNRILLATRLGLLHDIGKVFDVEVKDEKSGDIWDPMQEPLAYFKVRHELPILGPSPLRFVKGRGLNGHEEKGKKLISRLLHPRTPLGARSATGRAYHTYIGRYEVPPRPRPVPLDFIANCVHEADAESARRSRVKGSKQGDYLVELQGAAAANRC